MLIALNDGTAVTILNERDFSDLLIERLGFEASDYFNQIVSECDSLKVDLEWAQNPVNLEYKGEPN